MLPPANSSIERVVSFFSRDDERSRGNSFRTRACLAAINTPRYLFGAFAPPTMSLGVKTRIRTLALVERHSILQFELQPLHELGYLMPEPGDPLAPRHLRVDDRRHVVHRPLKIVVDDDVLVQIDRL